MAIINSNFSVGTAAILVVARDDNPQHVIVHNNERANNHEIYYGASGVTTSTGMPLLKTETQQFVLAPGDEIWAIADGAAREMRVLVRNI